MGSDTQECKLQVSFLYSQTIDLPIVLAAAANPGISHNLPAKILLPDLFAQEPPPNNLTLRCDDIKDVYTHDRDTVNGTTFIRWDTEVSVSIIDVMVDTSLGGVYSDYTFYDVVSWGDEMTITDNSPVCDSYHYYDPETPFHSLPLSEEELAEIRAKMSQMMQEQLAEYKNGYQTINRDFSAGSIRDRVFDLIAQPFDRSVSVLDYGSTLNELTSRKNGSFDVALGEDTGTVITGKYFTGLMGNPGASITFKQDGAEIRFSGQDVKTADDVSLINIGLTFAPDDVAMRAAAGPGSASFTYGFQHHGALPGMATFAIQTTLDEGSQVNVYKFDAAADQFTMIAQDLKVGKAGVVTYKNNTMSEYLITTGVVAGAAISDVASLQSGDASHLNGWWLALAALAIVLIGAGLWLLLRKKIKHEESNL